MTTINACTKVLDILSGQNRKEKTPCDHLNSPFRAGHAETRFSGVLVE